MYIVHFSASAYHQPVKPPTGQRRSGVKGPASYIPHQTVSSTANFPFASKQVSARPQSQIETVPKESSLDKVQRSMPNISVINCERQTQSPVSQQKMSQPIINQEQTSSITSGNTDLLNITKDLHRLSVDSASLEQARAMKQLSATASNTESSVSKSGSASSLPSSGSSNRGPANVSQFLSGESRSESSNSLGTGQGYQPGYQQQDIHTYNVVQEGK